MYISTGEMYIPIWPPDIPGGSYLQNEMYISSTKMYISTAEMYISIWQPPGRNIHFSS